MPDRGGGQGHGEQGAGHQGQGEGPIDATLEVKVGPEADRAGQGLGHGGDGYRLAGRHPGHHLAGGHQGAVAAAAEALVEGRDQADGKNAATVIADLPAGGEQGDQAHGQDDDRDQQREPLGGDLDRQHHRHDGPQGTEEGQQAEGPARRRVLAQIDVAITVVHGAGGEAGEQFRQEHGGDDLQGFIAGEHQEGCQGRAVAHAQARIQVLAAQGRQEDDQQGAGGPVGLRCRQPAQVPQDTQGGEGRQGETDQTGQEPEAGTMPLIEGFEGEQGLA